ncbi:hypothetical protein FGG90_11095 [Clavibacter tessellarius]|uniref:PGAP1-like protein n=1 Tax=Clavibacter tessellarius TaxID=31965 RepID=A0A225C706_9MICO|nr:hypothetical protein [Clavibacter michiganensis]OQJ62518.1 hypothetical protein B5P24_05625 [Clavibacter michiganensis subsp. tessellarius]UKF34492.1 hypothetical protein FGG90_11095 [Clavibacter michiganensis subsp. tessellarius]
MTAAVEGLTVTEGGGTAVETDDLTRIAARLDDEAGRLDDHARALALPPLVATITGDHDASLDAPRGLLSSAAHDARALAADLRRVAAEYADGERDVDRCVRSAAGDGAADAAPSSPGGPLRILLPAVVRDVVSDIAAAATRFLPARPAGDDGVRETTAGLLAALGAFGVLRDAPAMVHVRRDAVRPAPTSLQDLADRIPDPVPGTPQMRVEEYRVPDGRRRFVAYFGGMVTMDPGTGREDFGPASAAAALATEGGSAVHAAETALREAGATAEDEVYVVGYSMGGILARSVGDDPGFHVTHELTFGSPVGQLPIRQGIDGVAVEHADDPVPALGGVRPSDGDAGDDVVVRTPAFAPTVPAGVLDAHDLGTYRATATEMEASRSPLLERARDELHGFLDGATPVASHLYRAERAPLTPPRGSGGGM